MVGKKISIERHFGKDTSKMMEHIDKKYSGSLFYILTSDQQSLQSDLPWHDISKKDISEKSRFTSTKNTLEKLQKNNLVILPLSYKIDVYIYQKCHDFTPNDKAVKAKSNGQAWIKLWVNIAKSWQWIYIVVGSTRKCHLIWAHMSIFFVEIAK